MEADVLAAEAGGLVAAACRTAAVPQRPRSRPPDALARAANALLLVLAKQRAEPSAKEVINRVALTQHCISLVGRTGALKTLSN